MSTAVKPLIQECFSEALEPGSTPWMSTALAIWIWMRHRSAVTGRATNGGSTWDMGHGPATSRSWEHWFGTQLSQLSPLGLRVHLSDADPEHGVFTLCLHVSAIGL